MHLRCVWIVLVFSSSTVLAQPPAPVIGQTEGSSATKQAARRFPQAVRVGDLIGRQVLKPVEDQPVLGRVAAVTRRKDGGINVVVRLGGLFGVGTRPIDVPVEAVALLGEYVAVIDFTPEQLRRFPTADDSTATPLGPEENILVGLTRPFH